MAATCAGIPIMTACTPGTRPPTGSGSCTTWPATSGSWTARTRRSRGSWRSPSGSPAAGRAPRLISAKDHLGALDCDKTGQASVVEVRGTVHWLTHKDGPARALHVDPGRPGQAAAGARRHRPGGLGHRRRRGRRAGDRPGTEPEPLKPASFGSPKVFSGTSPAWLPPRTGLRSPPPRTTAGCWPSTWPPGRSPSWPRPTTGPSTGWPGRLTRPGWPGPSRRSAR